MILPFFAFEVEPLGASPLFSVGPLTITNTMLTGVLVAIVLISVLVRAARKSQLNPKAKLSFYVESIVELVLSLIVELFGDREKAMRYFPLLLSLFLFILACNLTGILPGIESITYFHNGTHTSLLRAWTTDLNATAALAVLTMAVVEIHAIREIGFKGYFQHYFTHQPWKPMNLFVGLLDVFGEFMRLVTLALRLFGVIYGGEALLFAIAAVTGNFGWAGMLPIFFLEIFFCFVQAYLFMMLSASYLVMSTSMHEQEAEHSGAVAQLSKATS
jgi:F-type H+-transporting ATPase subunit a